MSDLPPTAARPVYTGAGSFAWSDLERPAGRPLRLLIEASAGTGKTYTLERMVVYWLVRHRLPLSAILVVTFTRKATRELRTRIRRLLSALVREPAAADALVRELGLEPWATAGWRGHLQDQLRDFHQADIHTIHGFAHAILGRYPAESGALSGLRIDNGVVGDLLRDEVLATVVAGRVPVDFGTAVAPAVVAGAAPALPAGQSDPGRSTPGQPGSPESLSGPDLDLCLAQAFEVFACRSADDLLRKLGSMRDKGLFDPRQFAFGLVPGHDPALAWRRLRAAHWPAIQALLSPGSVPPADPAAIAALRAELPRLIPGLPLESDDDLRNGLSRYCAFSLARFLVNGLEAYRRRQSRYLGILGHNDLLEQLDQASAEGSLLLGQIRGLYRLILIDEFQDTDSLQWGIFARLAGPGDLVAVGDPKQAIYGFRGADLNTYLRARRELGNTRILERNFRSSQALVTGFNQLFGAVFAAGSTPGDATGNAVGTPPARLAYHPVRAGTAHPGAETLCDAQGRPLPPIRLVGPAAAAPDGGAATVEDFKRQLVGDITALIKAWCGGTHFYRSAPDTLRPLTTGDITVLCTTGADCRLVLRELQAAGIPAGLAGHGRLLEGHEAAELQVLLDALEDPGDPARVKAAALTRFFGLETAQAREANHSAQLGRIMDELFDWHGRFAQIGLPGVHACLEQRIRDRLLRDEPELALRTLTNFQHLVELFTDHLAGRHLPARSIGAEFRRYRDQGERLEEIPLRRESDAPRVRVMTMHSSKGLEFPVVFLFGDFRQFPPKTEPLWYELDGADPSGGWSRAVDPWLSADGKAGHRSRLREEWLRLFYVAATRAKALLCLPARGTPKSLYQETLDAAGIEAVLAAGGTQSAEPTVADGLTQIPAPSTSGAPGGPGVDAASHPPLALGMELPRQAPAGWIHPLYPAIERQSSFTGLSRRIDPDDTAGFGGRPAPREADEQPADGATVEMPVSQPAEAPRLPAGAEFGVLFHRAMEELDFAWGNPDLDADTRRALLRDFCRERIEPPSRGQSFGPGFSHFSSFADPFADLLGQTLAIGLPRPGEAPLALHRLSTVTRLPEIAFHARIRQAGTIAGHHAAENHAPLDIPPGFLTGVIDLLFRVDGRWHVIDWKTNLVPGGDCAAVMRTHHYGLQALIYQSAVLQFLCRQAGLAWDPASQAPGGARESAVRQLWETRMGRTWYLFVRESAVVDATASWEELAGFQRKAGLHVA
jgi:exodeoxyribonuclease V beta subunit